MANFVYKKIRELERLTINAILASLPGIWVMEKTIKTAFEKLKINQLKSD